jgi:hypothetical protein
VTWKIVKYKSNRKIYREGLEKVLFLISLASYRGLNTQKAGDGL